MYTCAYTYFDIYICIGVMELRTSDIGISIDSNAHPPYSSVACQVTAFTRSLLRQ